jgi:hypothetical protein
MVTKKQTRLVKIRAQKILEIVGILQNVIEKTLINLRVLSLVKINTCISDTPCIIFFVLIYRIFFF